MVPRPHAVAVNRAREAAVGRAEDAAVVLAA